MAKFFIDRPIFAIVVSLLIVLSGTIAGLSLPIAQYPQIQPPTVSVSTKYIGASAKIVNESVAQLIEEQVNGVQGMDYMSSTSDSTGSYSLDVIFDLSIDGDIASVKVQNNVSQANASLPLDVTKYGIVTKKSSSDMALVSSIYSPEGTHDAVFLYNYVKIFILDAIKRVNGVGDVTIFGADLARRVWLDPDKLAEYNLTVTDVVAAIQDQNIQAPAGTIGSLPISNNQEFQYTGQAQGRLVSVAQFADIIVKAQPNGAFVKLKDIAKVDDGSRMTYFDSKLNGQNSLVLAINLTSDANAMSTISQVKEILAASSQNFPPDMKYTDIIDNTKYISASLDEVFRTFVEALILVLLIVYLFLQSWRATLIPMLAVPVSLIGTFGAFVFLGFTINTLTLFAMVLAIGLVVDDAIVVVEAVEQHMASDKIGAREATRRAMAEISGPIVAITVVLASVFIPVAFLGGMMGVLYKQFALTIAVSMALSAIVALSLTPALCAILLKPHEENAHKGFIAKIFKKFNDWLERTTESYGKIVKTLIRHSKRTFMALIIIVVATLYLSKIVPSTFIPAEDQSFVVASVSLPEGASLNRTIDVMNRFSKELQTIPGVANVVEVSGYDVLSGGSKSNAGTCFVGLTDWSLRKSAQMQPEGIVKQIFQKGDKFDEASIIAMNPPSLPGLGMVGGFTMALQDIVGHTDEQLTEIINKILLKANTQIPEVTRVYTTFKNNSPIVDFEIDREKVKNLGVSLSDVFTTLQINFGGTEVNDFNLFGRTYKVSLQADSKFRTQSDNIKFMFVRSNSGALVPLSTLIKPQTSTSSPSITRFNGSRSIQINGSVAPGYSSGQAISAMENLIKTELPYGFNIEWSGQSREEVKAGKSTSQVMMLALVFVFLCLAALYESWAVPYAVLLSIPPVIFGAFFSQYITGLENSVYMQIGVITLIGLAARNAILIVEFAKIRTDDGMDPVQAALEAATLRLRPILMTAFTFIIGCMPLAIASGAGAGARNAMGTAVVGGMTIATILGLFLIPVLFVIVEKLSAKFNKNKSEQPPSNPSI